MPDQSQQGRGGGLKLGSGDGDGLLDGGQRKGREQTAQTNQGAGHPTEPGPVGWQRPDELRAGSSRVAGVWKGFC